MLDLSNAIKNTIPCNLFDCGNAEEIFKDVRDAGAKVVLKNDQAECVLLSPEAYMEMLEAIEDARLAALAADRMSRFSMEDAIPAERVYKKYGIEVSDEDIELE